MKKEISIALIIIGGLIILGLGYSCGYFSGQKGVEEIKVEEPLVSLLESKIIRDLTANASGEVTEISGRNLTLSEEGNTLTVAIKEEATINRLVLPTEEVTEAAVGEEIEFGEIKVGDQVSIFCKLKADGSLEGTDVMVLP